MKIACLHCGKKFHKMGIRNHVVHCVKRPIPVFDAPKPSPPDEGLKQEFARDESTRYRIQFRDVQIRALDSAAKAVDAIAHMLSDLRL